MSANDEADLFPQSEEQKKTSYGKSADQELSQSNYVLIVGHPRRARVEEVSRYQCRPRHSEHKPRNYPYQLNVHLTVFPGGSL